MSNLIACVIVLKLHRMLQELAFKSELEKSKLAARAAPGQDLQDIKRDLENTYAEQFKQLREMVRSSCPCMAVSSCFDSL